MQMGIMLVGVICLEVLSAKLLRGEMNALAPAFLEVLKLAIVSIGAWHTSKLDRMSAVYVGFWVMMVTELLREIPLAVMRIPLLPPELSMVNYLIARAVFSVLVLFVVHCTIARIMPTDGTYSIGPRQFTSALTLALIHMGVYSFIMSLNWMSDLSWPYIIILVLAQIYSISLLYMQVELFRKSAMKKEMAAINALLYKRKQQYDIARQNVQLINRRVHDLKRLVSKLEQGEEDAETVKVLQDLRETAGIYDAVVKTGSDVLDTVLTDKSLVCESKGIKITAVADGQSMAFLEAVDIFTIFNNILDDVIESVSNFKEGEKKSIDIMIYRRQKFLIINIIHPIFNAVKFHEGLPVPRTSDENYTNYSLKAVREVLRRYDGLLNCEEKNGIFTYRMVIPIV